MFSKGADRMGMAQGNWWKIKIEFRRMRKDIKEPKTLFEDHRNMKRGRMRRCRVAIRSILLAVKMSQ